MLRDSSTHLLLHLHTRLTEEENRVESLTWSGVTRRRLSRERVTERKVEQPYDNSRHGNSRRLGATILNLCGCIKGRRKRGTTSERGREPEMEIELYSLRDNKGPNPVNRIHKKKNFSGFKRIGFVL
ncbi:hypothetical protein KQX54_008338 [Cotesia glomerata]|uniref:Uncharacterized protein n=1 Tax=Cotesia glomerata TaxID=32391 RepID=A0AAV7HRV1_COTGL|nr:hypothetical protein KQX54_008338 [Cotesia glomerata]